MKKSLCLITALASLVFISCASLQQDVYTYTEDNNYIYTSIEIYENQFIKLDAKYHLNSQTPLDEINNLLTEITAYRTATNVTEPILLARLRAFEGLLNKMYGKNREAQVCWQEAYSLQKGDSYVQLLSSRLVKNQEDALTQIEGVLSFDSGNAVLLLEKGKLFYLLQKYDQAIAAMDSAFIIFDNEGLPDYREVYTPLRNNAWELNKIAGVTETSTLDTTDLHNPLSFESLVELTIENTSLLDNYKSTRQTAKTQDFIKALEKGGYFSSSKDQSSVIPSQITRKFCARFIWNAWVRKNGNLKMLTRYSDKYKISGHTKSPVNDVPVDDIDFDSVLGVVENEFMELPDGRNFYPDEEVTNLQFLTWIKKADK